MGRSKTKKKLEDKEDVEEAELYLRGFKKKDLVELFPYGVALDLKSFTSSHRPVIFFRTKDEKQVLPVWVHPLDAEMALIQQENEGPHPYDIVWKLFGMFGGQLDRCIFVDIKGYDTRMELHFSGLKDISLQGSASELISLGLSAGAKFYCQHDFIKKCRTLREENPNPKLFVEKNIKGQDWPTYLN